MRWLERLGSALLLLFYGLAAVGQAMALAHSVSVWSATAVSAATVTSEAATMTFLALQCGLVVTRRPAEQSARGVAPLLVTWLAVALPAAFFVLPRAQPGPATQLASLLALTVGMTGSIYVLTHLGRCFSILPQARGLVTAGPYARVRHPLYAAELLSTAGVMLQFAQPWALVLFFAMVLALLARMRFEEAVLRGTYPAYRDYMHRTWRLIPGLY